MKRTSEPERLLRVAVYIRVSSEEQAERGDSIRDQKERGIRYIKEHKNMVLQDIYLDDGVSGQKIDRDDFTRLMNHIKEGQIDLIIFTKLDRWFRSLRHYLNTQAILEKYNAAWTAIDQPYFDTSTPYGRAFVAQSMTWAELEAQNGGIRVSDVFKTKVEHGEVITGKVPRGYQIKNKRMVLSNEASAIHDGIMHFLKHHSMNQSVLYIKEKYGICMTPQNFRQSLLRNEKLTGRYRGNDNYCPRLISDEDFKKIQRILENNNNIKAGQKYPYIFSGLLVCGECQGKMGGCQINVLSKRKNGTVVRYKYPAYECKQTRSHKDCCNRGEIRELRLEENLLQYVRKEFYSYVADFQTSQKQATDNRAKKNQIQKKLGRLKDLYLNEAITLEEFKRDKSKMEEQLKSLPDTVLTAQDSNKVKSLLNTSFEIMYQKLDNEQKRLFWRSIIKEIIISKSTGRRREYTVIFI
jgi:site-specific DNA recombinase